MTVRTSTPLPAGTIAVPAARHFTAQVMADWPIPAQTREIAELVVSELVGNAVQHGDGIAELGLSLGDEVIRVEVVDNSPVLPVLLSPEPAGDRHRGLLIVAAVSRDWGARREARGKTVWADLPRTATGQAAAITTTETTPDASPTVDPSVTEIVTAPTGRTPVAERSPTG